MRRMILLAVIAACPLAALSDPHGLTAADLVSFARVSEPALSPDGRRLVYSLRETDLAADRGRSDLWLTDIDGGTPARRLIEHYPDLLWLKTLVEVGAIAGLTSVILVMMLGQPRIFYSMSRDGLIPPLFGRIHPKFRTPHVGTVIVGATAVVLAGLLPIGVLGELVSMGTLLAFATVCIGVLVLRKTRPDLPRAFRVPAAPVVCILGAAACLYLFFPVFMANWHWMSGWIVIGFLIYFGYSRRHSKLNEK